MAQFSGAIKIADGFDDYQAPAQNCVQPLPTDNNADTQSVLNVQDELDVGDILVNLNSSSKRRLNTVEGSNFAQIQNSDTKATITQNDCLACSGCVTSAETILITQQSGAEFFKILELVQNSRRGNGIIDPEQVVKSVVVSVSPQSLASLAATQAMSLEEAWYLLSDFFSELGVDNVISTFVGQQIALTEAMREFECRYRNKITGDDSQNKNNQNITKYSIEVLNNIVSFAHKSQQSSVLPLISSECPGWSIFAEKTQGERCVPLMSSVTTPMSITGVLAKHVYRGNEDRLYRGKQVYHVSITPCYDKKFESAKSALRNRDHTDDINTDNNSNTTTTTTNTLNNDHLYIDNVESIESSVDLVLTTTEVIDMMLGREVQVKEDGQTMELVEAKHSGSTTWEAVASHRHARAGERTRVVHPFTNLKVRGEGLSGNYAEAVFLHACQAVYGLQVQSIDWVQGSNSDFHLSALEYHGQVDGQGVYCIRGKQNTYLSGAILNEEYLNTPMFKRSMKYKWFARAYGFRNIQNIVKIGSPNYDYVELMACPGGCANGGGQVRAVDRAGLENLQLQKYDQNKRRKGGVEEQILVDDSSANSLVMQKALVSTLEALANQQPSEAPTENIMVQRIQRDLWTPGSQEAHAVVHTHFQSLTQSLPSAVIPKW